MPTIEPGMYYAGYQGLGPCLEYNSSGPQCCYSTASLRPFGSCSKLQSAEPLRAPAPCIMQRRPPKLHLKLHSISVAGLRKSLAYFLDALRIVLQPQPFDCRPGRSMRIFPVPNPRSVSHFPIPQDGIPFRKFPTFTV